MGPVRQGSVLLALCLAAGCPGSGGQYDNLDGRTSRRDRFLILMPDKGLPQKDLGRPPDSKRPPDVGQPKDTKPPLCVGGELEFGGHCYRMTGILGLTFDTAKGLCGGMSPPMKMVAITSAAENKFVYDQLPIHNQLTWIGLRRTGQGAQDFAWESGEPVSFWNWAQGEPNNEKGGESCVVIWGPMLSYANLRSFWNDAPCEASNVANVVCERTP